MRFIAVLASLVATWPGDMTPSSGNSTASFDAESSRSTFDTFSAFVDVSAPVHDALSSICTHGSLELSAPHSEDLHIASEAPSLRARVACARPACDDVWRLACAASAAQTTDVDLAVTLTGW